MFNVKTIFIILDVKISFIGKLLSEIWKKIRKQLGKKL